MFKRRSPGRDKVKGGGSRFPDPDTMKTGAPDATGENEKTTAEPGPSGEDKVKGGGSRFPDPD